MYIALENGETIKGKCASPGSAKVELVFTTAYTGYEESITDPSYNGQGIIFCYPLIGNYGVKESRFESDEIQPNAIIAREFTEDISDWLEDTAVPAIEGIDTRYLTIAIREEGSMVAGIASNKKAAQKLCAEAKRDGVEMIYEPPNSLPEEYGEESDDTIVLLDCGVKNAMISRLVDHGANVVRVPWTIDDIEEYNADLLFVSNGPGDPQEYQNAIDLIKKYHTDIPIAGICLGMQLIALALGGETEKMKFGHRGTNQPVYSEKHDKVRMSSQNHQFEVSDIPDELNLMAWNINDESPEALEGDKIKVIQWHAESNPGPNDSEDFFADVMEMI